MILNFVDFILAVEQFIQNGAPKLKNSFRLFRNSVLITATILTNPPAGFVRNFKEGGIPPGKEKETDLKGRR